MSTAAIDRIYSNRKGYSTKVQYPQIDVKYDDENRTLTYVDGGGSVPPSLIQVLLQQNLELREEIKRLQEWIISIENELNELYHSPPEHGGPGYQEALKSFNEHKDLLCNNFADATI